MSRAPQLDFVGGRRPGVWAWLLLVAGAAAALGAGRCYLEASAAHDEAAARLSSQRQQVAATTAKPAVKPDAKTEARARLEAAAAHELDVSWSELVGAIQGQQNKDVALLSLEADSKRGDFRLVALARGYPAMMDYVKRLQVAGPLSQVSLTRHEAEESDGVAAVRFALHGFWGKQ